MLFSLRCAWLLVAAAYSCYCYFCPSARSGEVLGFVGRQRLSFLAMVKLHVMKKKVKTWIRGGSSARPAAESNKKLVKKLTKKPSAKQPQGLKSKKGWGMLEARGRASSRKQPTPNAALYTPPEQQRDPSSCTALCKRTIAQNSKVKLTKSTERQLISSCYQGGQMQPAVSRVHCETGSQTTPDTSWH